MSATLVEGNTAHKRKRSEMEADMDESPTRSRIWFEDGNIVLQAENVQFKFYKGLLAMYSPFFEGAFSVPQPTVVSDVDAVDGCQMMKLQDTAADVEYLLSYIIEPKLSTTMPSIADVIAALKMGHKYLVSSLWEDAVARLRFEFPDTLEEYRMRRDAASGLTRIRQQKPGEKRIHLVDVVRNVGLQRILPVLYFHTVEFSILDLLISGIPTVPRLESPSMEARLILLGGRARMLAATHKAYRNMLELTRMPKGCDNIAACRESRRNLRDAQSSRLETHTRLTVFDDSTEIAARAGALLCHACLQDLRQQRLEEQRTIWDALPSFFGLPGWEGLQNFEIA